MQSASDIGHFVMTSEVGAIQGVMRTLDWAAFERAVEILAFGADYPPHPVWCVGVGKSGIAARKFAATLSTLGIQAVYVSPSDLMHGQLGAVQEADRVVLISHNGETEELRELRERLPSHLYFVVPVVGNPESSLAKEGLAAKIGGDPYLPVPTSSFAGLVAICDALAIAVALRRGVTAADIVRHHPGGATGKMEVDHAL